MPYFSGSSPENPVLSQRPVQGSRQINGAVLLGLDHTPSEGKSGQGDVGCFIRIENPNGFDLVVVKDKCIVVKGVFRNGNTAVGRFQRKLPVILDRSRGDVNRFAGQLFVAGEGEKIIRLLGAWQNRAQKARMAADAKEQWLTFVRIVNVIRDM